MAWVKCTLVLAQLMLDDIYWVLIWLFAAQHVTHWRCLVHYERSNSSVEILNGKEAEILHQAINCSCQFPYAYWMLKEALEPFATFWNMQQILNEKLILDSDNNEAAQFQYWSRDVWVSNFIFTVIVFCFYLECPNFIVDGVLLGTVYTLNNTA